MYTVTIENDGIQEIMHGDNPESSSRLKAGKFTEGVNLIPSAVFSVLPFNPCYDKLKDRRTIVKFNNSLTGETEFEGTLMRSGEQMTNSGTVYKNCTCEGLEGFLCDSIQPYFHYEGYTESEFLEAILEHHNEMVSEDKRIYLGMCDFPTGRTNSKTTAYRTTFDEIKTNLTERVGGEIRVRRDENGILRLDYMIKTGVISQTKIELAKNINNIEVETDSLNIVTRLIPLGAQLNDETAERVGIESVNDGKPYIDDENAIEKYGIIVGTAEFDDITLPENLIEAGRQYQQNNNRVKKSYRAEVLDLSCIDNGYQSIKSGNTYHFVHQIMGIDEELRLMKRTVDIFRPYKPEIEIGDKAERITDIASRTAELIEYELPKQRIDILTSARETAAKLINEGINGKVVVNPNEILILGENPETETVEHLWRFNMGGLGYSKDGGQTYETAITMDGRIVADFITAGILRGIEIMNGNGFKVDPDGNVECRGIEIMNGNGFKVDPDGNVECSAIKITGGEVNITTQSETQDKIILKYEKHASLLCPFEFKLKNENSDTEAHYQAGGVFIGKVGAGADEFNTVISKSGVRASEIHTDWFHIRPGGNLWFDYDNNQIKITDFFANFNILRNNFDTLKNNFDILRNNHSSLADYVNNSVNSRLNDLTDRVKALEDK